MKDVCTKILYHQVPRPVPREIAIINPLRVTWDQRRETLEPLLQFCNAWLRGSHFMPPP